MQLVPLCLNCCTPAANQWWGLAKCGWPQWAVFLCAKSAPWRVLCWVIDGYGFLSLIIHKLYSACLPPNPLYFSPCHQNHPLVLAAQNYTTRLTMTSDCNDVPGDIAYNCSNPWGWGCRSSEGFNFASLWNYTQSIQKACESDSRLFGVSSTLATPQNAALTQSSCPAIAGSSWRYYPGAEIWTRLTAWKFPLLQLVASFPRPPLSFWVELFVINHLLGDPIDTIKNLLTKMSNCQRVAKYWKEQRQHQVVHGDDTINRGWRLVC